MKIAIVGAREDKWTKEQKEKVIKIIRKILFWAKEGWILHPPFRFECNRLKIHRLQMNSNPLSYINLIMVSGHCPKGGVDIWAEEIADEFGIKKEIYSAEVHQWKDRYIEWLKSDHRHNFGKVLVGKNQKGYRSRNIQIAKACDVLYCLVPNRITGKVMFNRDLKCIHCNVDGHPTNGGCWTMNYAKKLGKEVYQIIIE